MNPRLQQSLEARSTISASNDDLHLQVSFDAAQPLVKVYDLIPNLGIVKGFGVNKKDRSSLVKALELRGWTRRDGVYLLFRHMTINYVGITQNIDARLNTHTTRKKGEYDWDRVLVFYAIPPILNTNIAGFAEATLYLHLKERGFELLQNEPSERLLNPEDQKIVRRFVLEIERILELLDLSQPTVILTQTIGKRPESQGAVSHEGDLPIRTEIEQDVAALVELHDSAQQEIEVELNASGAHARGKYTSFGLQVYAGSAGAAEAKPHLRDNQAYLRMRKELEDAGVITIEDAQLRFVRSYTFTSPTAAARILCGSSVPGPLFWKRISDGTPLVKIRL